MSIGLIGDWTGANAALEPRGGVRGSAQMVMAEVASQLEEGGFPRIQYDTSRLTAWDSKLVVLVRLIDDLASKRRATVDHTGLPEGLRRLVRLSRAVPPREASGDASTTKSLSGNRLM